MHILMYRWKAYNYRDIEQTFLLLGHTVDNIEQELGSYDVSPEFERVIEEKIRGTHYDMVFTVNYFPLISNVCERTGVKYISWTCDNPLIKNRLPEYLRGYFDAVMEAQLNISGANIVEPMLTTNILEQLQEYFQLEKSEGSFSDLGLIFQTTVLGFKIAEIERRRALIELSKHYKVNVYSNSDVSDLLQIQYCGSVDYWSEMPKVFRMSKINLNFTIPNIKSGIPLRIWDVLGCGGFLLTNYQAEIPYYFKEGEDLVCFDGLEDLCEKVGYYLEHEEERKRIAWNGYHKVREKHSYIERIHTILDTVAGEDAK